MRMFNLLLCATVTFISCDKLIHYADSISFYYVNNSDYDITISAYAPNVINNSVKESTIAVGDTIRYFSSYSVNGIDSGPFGTPDTSATVVIEFDSVDKKCLKFSGPVTDPLKDIRSHSAYSTETPPQERIIHKYYIINSTHYQQSATCN